MVLRLAGRSVGTEVPLLPRDLVERLAAIGRPAQHVFLGACHASLDKLQPDPPDRLRIREEQPDDLLTGTASTPTRTAGQQCFLDRMSGVLRLEFHLDELVQIQPVVFGGCRFLLNRGDNSLAHPDTS